MAMFCLLLAVVAFVLTGGPQVCRCDRPAVDRDFYRAAVAGDGLGGNIWGSLIGQRALTDPNLDSLRHDDGINLIPGTGPVHGIPALAKYREGTNLNEPMALASLINRYRKYMVEKIVRFDDACSLLYGEPEGDGELPATSETYTERTEISVGRAQTEGSPDDSRRSADASGRPQREGLLLEAMRLPPAMSDSCSGSAMHYYRCLMARVNDQQLINMMQDYLDANCYRHDSLNRSTGLHKRDTPRYVSKQKFHSWGGKRNSAQVFYPWGGKRNVQRSHKQPKVVIRNPFHSWGGKRNGLPLDSSA